MPLGNSWCALSFVIGLQVKTMVSWSWAIFRIFRGIKICINFGACQSHPNSYIPQSHRPYKSRFLVETSYVCERSTHIVMVLESWLSHGCFFVLWDPKMGLPLRNWKEDRTTTNKTGFSNYSSRSMSSPGFIEFGQPPFPRSDRLSQSGPLKRWLENPGENYCQKNRTIST